MLYFLLLAAAERDWLFFIILWDFSHLYHRILHYHKYFYEMQFLFYMFFIFFHCTLIKPNIVLQSCNYERTEVGGQNALNALRMNAGGNCCQENYWATVRHRKKCFCQIPVYLFCHFLHITDARSNLTKMRSMSSFYLSLKTLNSGEMIHSNSATTALLQEMRWFTQILLSSPARPCVLSLWSRPPLPVFPFSIFLSFDNMTCHSALLSHERVPAPTSQQPLIGQAFSRSVSCCLIITLFDCWSRDVIDWSAHPVWGLGFWSSPVCAGGCVLKCGGVLVDCWTALQISIQAHIPQSTMPLSHTHICLLWYCKT